MSVNQFRCCLDHDTKAVRDATEPTEAARDTTEPTEAAADATEPTEAAADAMEPTEAVRSLPVYKFEPHKCPQPIQT